MTKKPTTTPVRMTDVQISALKYLVIHSQDATDAAKRIFCWLLDQSKNLTRPVRVNVRPESFDPRFSKLDGKFVMTSFNELCSTGGQTHIDAIMKAMGATLEFSYHSGYFPETGERVDGGDHFSVWFAHKQYDRTAKLLSFERNTIFSGELESTLYYNDLRAPVEFVKPT